MSEDRGGPLPDEADELDELDEELDPDEPEETHEPEPAEPEATPQQPSREDRRIHVLRQRERDARDEAQRLRTERDQLLAQTRQAPQQPDPYRQAELDRQENERVAMMAPHEVAAHYANRSEQRFRQELARMNVEMADRTDRMSFDAFSQTRPTALKMAAEVERTLGEARQQGMNPTRQSIYHLLLGREVDAKASRQIETQRTNGRRRIASQETRPAAPRSNAPAERRGGREESDAAFEARLRNGTIGEVW